MTIRLDLNNKQFTLDFQGLVSRTRRPQGMLKVAGREVANRLKSHFRGKDKSGANRTSTRRSHFWNAIAGSVQNPVLEDANTVSVTIADPRFAQKLYGGVIHAKLAAALTIPVEERAYDRTARTFEAETGLKLILIKTGKGNFENAVLAVAEGGGLTVEYVLTPQVDQEADDTALPEQSALEAAVLARSQKVLDTEILRNSPTP